MFYASRNLQKLKKLYHDKGSKYFFLIYYFVSETDNTSKYNKIYLV